MKRYIAMLAMLVIGPSVEARPLEAIEAQRAAADAELADLDRRAGSLDVQLGFRESLLRRRLRALYKLAQGGSFRLLANVKSPDELEDRMSAARRLVSRDLGELSSIGEELSELGRDRARRSETLAQEGALKEAGGRAASEPATGLQRRRGQLARPVPGVVTVGLGHVRVREPHAGFPPLEMPRRAVELASTAGEPVRAIASGTVRWIGELEGLGRAVIVDHGDRYVSVSGRLGKVSVEPGTLVTEGKTLGTARGSTISFELTEGRMPLDPVRWLKPPPSPPATLAP